jgi:NAD(P)-dependent dehydrogenase (short-subunit alcohol dehydrogenase family)
MTLPLEGFVAVVTGGGRGIGRATVRAFATAGAQVAFCARSRPEIEEVARELGEGHLGLWDVDVSKPEDVASFARAVEDELGTPDVVVANAGVALRATVDATSDDAWAHVIAVNLTGTFYTVRAFDGAMRAARRGRIVCVSSISGRRGTARSTAYCAAKHGVGGFARALADELRSDGIQVNAVCPGSVETAMLPPEFAPGMPPEQVADMILWLAAAAPASLTGACIDQFG